MEIIEVKKENILPNKLRALRVTLENFEKVIEEHPFNDEENREEALDEINGAIIALDEIEDVIERDKELKIMQEAVAET